MKKKIFSILLVAVMVMSMLAVAGVSSSAWTGEITFKVPSAEWAKANKMVYAHFWNSKTGEGPSWKTAEEKMKYNSDKTLATKTLPEGDWDLIIIAGSSNEGWQTYDTVMTPECIGDTIYDTGELVENPVDSKQVARVARWEKTGYGAHKVVSSTGNIIGDTLVPGETNDDVYNAFVTKYDPNGDTDTPWGSDPAQVGTFEEVCARVRAALDSEPTNPEPTTPDPTTPDPTTPEPTTPEPTEAPTEAPTAAPTEAPTAAVVDPYGRIPGLPLPADLNVPAKDTNREALIAAGAPESWDGYYNIYYFEAPQEWIDNNKDMKDEGFEIGFYWYCGSISNDTWPGVPAIKLDVPGMENIYYGYAPSFATNIIWNNGISDAVAENKQYKLQTEDIKVDDPMLNPLIDKINETYPDVEGAYVAGCLSKITEVKQVTNPLTQELQDVYVIGWEYFNPRTGETTTEPLMKDGQPVTVADSVWEYEKVALNPYFDMNYDHVNEGEVPTQPGPAVLPTEAGTSVGTSANGTSGGATNNNNSGSTTSGKTVNTADSAVAIILVTVLASALAVGYLARKRVND